MKVMDWIYKYGTLAVIGLVIVFFSVLNPYFFTYGNLADILRSISIVTLVAIGVTFSLIVNGFDLSVGSIVSFATVVSSSMMIWYEQGLLVTLMVPILLSVLIGWINSLLIVKIRIPDLLATLATLYIVKGIHLTYTKGYSIYANMPMTDGSTAPGKFNESFLWLGQGQMASIPVPVLLMLLAVIVVHVYLNYTRQGRLLYITGGNAEAARLSGVPVERYRTLAYLLSGLFCGLAGILLAARIGTGQVDGGAPLLMDAVAAAFVGYSVFGAGKPNVIGTFFGAVLIGVLLNGMTMLNLPYYAHDIVKGTVLVLALAVTYYQLRRRKA
ncbi:ABC transporter permease [Ammoniphilus sp. YIM 78166]|uniref:ABC transporter permease n=1 Tax=Ammoniphilus sp. YIM 78166 TaxID=1644106 RepID=UPI00106F649F|nr:ABC transporter permease [Ammoniphilus sp. YIM 78166]